METKFIQYFINRAISLNFALPNPRADGYGACLQVIT